MSNNNTKQPPPAEWCTYDSTDPTYHGAKQVVEAELDSIRRRRPEAKADDLTGLALSGGGIRSASFSLGVMQALARKGRLKRFDYLSTVSGGGYIGSSLTWLLHKEWTYKDADGNARSVQFGLDADTFPYKTDPVWGVQSTPPQAPPTTASNQIPAYVKGAMLRWLRQNGKYLTPGGCHNLAALTAVVLRGTLVSMLVYLSMLVLWFKTWSLTALSEYIFNRISWCLNISADCSSAPFFLVMAGWSAGVFVVLALFYSVTTFFSGFTPRDEARSTLMDRYNWRRIVECGMGMLLVLIAILIVIGISPIIGEAVENKTFIASISSLISTLGGIGSSIRIFVKSNAIEPSKWTPLLVSVASALLLIGMVPLSYLIAFVFWPQETELSRIAYLILATLLVVGWFSNLNYISVHRYYRDRLMETFMPNVADAVVHAGSQPGTSREADRMHIQDNHSDNRPYHLINTNVVLVESPRPKFKGRGGDNFILSPLYCGSNATGWCRSDKFMGGGMTLATAMAISGAAVNPSTGVGGDGMTRQPILSSLMGLLNIRLGYWAPNPNPKKQPLLGKTPNFFWPGLWEVILRKNLNEDTRFIQLSDGGHFENLGLYELLRRRLKLIVVCDGGADPNYTFGDLANAIEKARADFGALIDITSGDLQALIARAREGDADGERPEKFAERGHLIADIHYADKTCGKLIYLTTTFTRGLSADLYGYRKEHPEFPDEPTGDQFFDEKQFEAYRELGFQLAWKMLDDAQGII